MVSFSEELRKINPHLEEHGCENCGKMFWRRIKGVKPKKTSVGIRGVGYKTCSPECSKERIVKRLGGHLRIKNE